MTAIDRPHLVRAIDLRVGEPLGLTPDLAEAVAAHWRAATAANPALWNGSAFLFEAVAIVDGVFSARARPTNFATLLYRLRVGFERPATAHVFPVAAVTSRDGRLLIGRQGRDGANAGLVYPPSGSFDAMDVVDGRLDPVANMRRELAEEVGLDLDAFPADRRWWALPSGVGRVALVRRHRSALTTEALRAHAVAGQATARDDEIDRIDLVGGADRLADEATVPYVPLLLDLIAAERRDPETLP
ncbi:MAG: hypothetical protein GX458_09090 [Phyllobacteriaceae bacterium]|nr:hypothetical protein [Phyllobacteriaceae bacterium]